MIKQIHFQHVGEKIHSLLVFNFAAVKDVIMVVPRAKDIPSSWSANGKVHELLFSRTSAGIWVCRDAVINRFPDTFSHLKETLLQYFDEACFEFRMRPQS